MLVVDNCTLQLVEHYFPYAITTPAAIRHSVQELPTIEGLDTAEGLSYVDNSVELYLQILHSFEEHYADVTDQITRAMAGKRWADAGRIVHTIKSLLGSIGAQEAQQHTESLERALKLRSKLWIDSLESLSVVLSPLLVALREHFSATPIENNEGTENCTTILSWYNEFEALLREGNFKAIDLWNSGKYDLTKLFDSQSSSQISGALANFDFEEAVTIARNARRTMPQLFQENSQEPTP